MKYLIDGINEAMNHLEHETTAELISQGHKGTGGLINSFKRRTFMSGQMFVSEMEMRTYGIILDKGIKPNRIPFGGKRGRGGRSKYIQGLLKFVRSKGMPDSAAFAIANKQKQEGNPTRGSRRFSRTGKRRGWLTIPLSREQAAVDKIIADATEKQIFADIDRIVQKAK